MHTTPAERTLASRWNPRVLCMWPIAKSCVVELHTDQWHGPALTSGTTDHGPGVVDNLRASVPKVYLRFNRVMASGHDAHLLGGESGLTHGVLCTETPVPAVMAAETLAKRGISREQTRGLRLQLPILAHPPARTPGSTVVRLETASEVPEVAGALGEAAINRGPPCARYFTWGCLAWRYRLLIPSELHFVVLPKPRLIWGVQCASHRGS
jgi:hypothetical protein